MPSITRRSRATRRERRDTVRDQLLAAIERLVERGESYTELSVERLVEEAGISRSTFYVYFADKGELLGSLAEDSIAAMIEAGRWWWELPPSALKEDVQGALRTVFDTYLEHRGLFAAVVEVAGYDSAVREQFGGLMERVIDELADHIRRGQDAGYVHEDLDPQRTAAWLCWMAERGLYQLVAGADEHQREALLQALTDIVWHTLYEGKR